MIAIDRKGEGESGISGPAQPETSGRGSTVGTEGSPQTGQSWRPWWIVVAGMLVMVVGAGVFFTAQKKKDKEIK